MKRIIRYLVVGLLIGVMLICPVFAVSAFPDVDENATYAEAAEYLSEIGIMVGDNKGNFNPDKAVTRAEMATVICRMLGETENSTADGSTFTDVPAGHWASGYISQAASLGIVNGYGNGKFGPGDTVTYEQAVTMTVRALGYEDEANASGGYPSGYLSIAQDIGLLNGVNAQNGTPLARKDVAIIIFNSYHSYV